METSTAIKNPTFLNSSKIPPKIVDGDTLYNISDFYDDKTPGKIFTGELNWNIARAHESFTISNGTFCSDVNIDKITNKVIFYNCIFGENCVIRIEKYDPTKPSQLLIHSTCQARSGIRCVGFDEVSFFKEDSLSD